MVTGGVMEIVNTIVNMIPKLLKLKTILRFGLPKEDVKLVSINFNI